MVCQTANELQARLALRALWPPPARATGGDDDANDNGPPTGHISILQRKLRAEMEEVLRASQDRRLKRIQRQIAVLCSENGVKPVSPAAPSVAASSATSDQSVAVQTEDVEARQRLVTALEHSLQSADAASRTPQKTYGPSGRQSKLLDPEDKTDGLVSENKCMKATLEQLDRSLNSRERQIAALQSQLETCKNMQKVHEDATKIAAAALRELVANTASVPRMYEERLRSRQQRVAKKHEDLIRNKQKDSHYQALAVQQKHYYLQNERIGMTPGAADRLQRHPAGDLFLWPRPPHHPDTKAEAFDIGTAIANPYVCDSWPFEPNVLASRTLKEATMQVCIEETDEDLEEEPRRLPFLQLRLPAPGRGCDDEEDDFDDRYNGPSETARSL